MERFLKLSEVQQMLGVSRSTVWRWSVEHGLKTLRVGNVTRLRESDLQAFLARHVSEGSVSASGQTPELGAGVRESK